jgi:hypothetical protein
VRMSGPEPVCVSGAFLDSHPFPEGCSLTLERAVVVMVRCVTCQPPKRLEDTGGRETVCS